MLYLVFEIGSEGYALPVAQVVELLPFIDPKPIREAPAEIVGAISYRGEYLPVVDACALELGRPARRSMGTRIAIVETAAGAVEGRGGRKIGLILENATETLRCDPSDFDPFATGPRGLVQSLDLSDLLPPHVIDAIGKTADLPA